MRTVAFTLFGEDSASAHHYRVTAGPAHVAVTDVPDGITDEQVGVLLNATMLFRRTDARLDVPFDQLGHGRIVLA